MGTWGPAVILLLALSAPLATFAASSKYACDYSNRLCQWKAKYVFGATVLGDKAFFNGGILSNDANTPVNGSAFEVLDLQTLSPYVIQVQDDSALATSRYRHQLVVWKDKILAVGGERDDSNGMSQHILNVIELDLNTRQWKLFRKFDLRGTKVEIKFQASVVAGDRLLIVAQFVDPQNPSQRLVPLNLVTKGIDNNFYLAEGAEEVLDWPLTGIMPLNAKGDFPYLVVQARRQLPRSSLDTGAMTWFEVHGKGKVGSDLLTFTANTALKQLPGGSGGKVLSLSILQVLGKPTMVVWATTSATFTGKGALAINTISMYAITVKGATGQRSASLQLTRVLMTPPLSVPGLAGLQSVDLPLHGNVQVSAADVTAIPYVGNVDLIGELDSSNVNIQPWAGKGFIARGSGIADYSCQPAAAWQPFVMMVDLSKPAAAVSAVSNNTWCATRQTQTDASRIVSAADILASNTKLHRVESGNGALLMVVNAQIIQNPGGQLTFADTEKPLKGAYISVRDSTVSSFDIPAAKGYKYPAGVAACTTVLDGQPVYVQHGGHYIDEHDGKEKTSTGFFSIAAQPGKQHSMLAASGGAGSVPGATYASMACGADDKLYMFGGLAVSDYTEETYEYPNSENATAYIANWAATNGLYQVQLGGSSNSPVVRKVLQLGSSGKGAATPPARSGQALTYLPPNVVSQLGMQDGALLLYGGSNLSTPTIGILALDESAIAEALADTMWDTSAWLFNLATSKWVKLSPVGADAPPGLMYHSMAVQGNQAMLYGGLRFVEKPKRTVRISTDMYILDFSEAAPRWRRAPVDNINVQGAYQLAFPNTGIAPLPESGAVALMHKSGISVTAIPQSIQVSDPQLLTKYWGLNSINLTAGDWIRLPAAGGDTVTLQQPLLLASDILVTGAGSAGGGRALLQKDVNSRLPVLHCGRNATSAVSIRSSGALLENVVITGCNGSAVDIQIDATGAYTSPAVLRNVHIKGNNGSQGVAVRVGASASVMLESCHITGNAATDSTVYAESQSSLWSINSTVSRNNGTGIKFAGSALTITGSQLDNNNATNLQGGALRIVCEGSSVVGCNSMSTITNTTFVANRAQWGGAVFMDANAFASLSSVMFEANTAEEGGAVLADRDACLFNMVTVNFTNNRATKKGGAVLMRSASCANITWQGLRFQNNKAGGSGGAVYLSEMAKRNITGQATFAGNQAGHDGGALYLGLWSSTVTLYNSTFTGNNATSKGGAVSSLAIDSSITINNTKATNNLAGPAPVDELLPTGWQSLSSEGGAVHVGGNNATLVLINTQMDENQAAKGGAVSVSSDSGSFTAQGSSFSSNTAVIVGGAVAVTERKAANISDTTFTANSLTWPELSAGGGFYCFLCSSVTIKASNFSDNKASYGGGAAVLQPAKKSSIVNSLFYENLALPIPNMRGRVMKEGNAGSHGSKQKASAAILGPIGGNTTADSGTYTGGGGLYLSVSSEVEIAGCSFVANTAYNGGGLLARTDVCKTLAAQSLPCQLVLDNVAAPTNMADGGGTGLLITDIRPGVVTLRNCSAGEAINLNTTHDCLAVHSAYTRDVLTRSGRHLLQEATSSSDGSDRFLATSAASMTCGNVDSAMNDTNMANGIVLDHEDCSQPIEAAPGAAFNPALGLVDGLGRNVTTGIYDAQMPMQVTVLLPNNTRADMVLLGDTTKAVNGTAVFAGLTVKARPDVEHYKLHFTTQSGLSLVRKLRIRECWVGESTSRTNFSNGQAAYECVACRSPDYSFYPNADGCGQCLALADNGYAVCNGPAVVPANGFYQSHPRSPLLHRCISHSACRRWPENVTAMAKWASNHRRHNITLLNAPGPDGVPVYQGYMQYMCAAGYTGPLCGSCQKGYGHSASTCYRCLPRPVNNFLYFLVCVFMFLIPALNMWLHSKNVKKRSAQVQEAATRARRASRTSSTIAAQESIAAGKYQQPAMQPAAAANIAGAIQLTSMPLADTSSTQLDQNAPAVYGSVNGTTAPISPGVATGSTFDMMPGQVAHPGNPLNSPFALPPAQTVLMANGQSNTPGDQLASFLSSKPTKSGGILSRLFDYEALDDDDDANNPWSTAPSPSAATSSQPNLMQPPTASAPRSISMPAEHTGGVLGAGAMPAAVGAVRRRSLKFWHADVLMMLVSYMQLLGLLRLIRLNWPALLQRLLVYFDFTSGASTWASLECSLSDNTVLPRSLQRSIVLLLWPLAALAVLCVYWGVCAALVARRRRATFWESWRKYLGPHIIMSFVVMLYFLYTPTSREIISLFSYQRLDTEEELRRQASQSTFAPDALDALNNSTVWTSDTSVVYASPAHLGVMVGMGVPGMLLFVLGLPIALAVILVRNVNRVNSAGQRWLEDEKAELQYGLMYEKYKYRRCYWECVVLLENCALTILLVMLQSQPATLQVLVAMGVIFIESVLHITFKPYACKMLDTLRRVTVFGLMATLFLIMLVSLSEFEDQQHVINAALVVIFIINLLVVLMHVAACLSELRRWLTFLLDKEGKGYFTREDLYRAIAGILSGTKVGRSSFGQWLVRQLGGTTLQQQQSAMQGGARARGPPQEFAVGSVYTVNPDKNSTSNVRQGNIIVVHPAQNGDAANYV